MKLISDIGGIFFILAFWHFVIDWFFQSQYHALNKIKNEGVLFRHCAIYTLGFMPLLFLMFGMSALTIDTVSVPNIVLISFYLFLNHMLVDTYLPTLAWVKYVRRPDFDASKTQAENFLQFAKTPIGLILIIAIDQMLHLLCILPIAFGYVTSNYIVMHAVTAIMPLVLGGTCKVMLKHNTTK